MTAEKFHDALTLLPADLVAETDAKRRGRPKVTLWKRYVPMAACFVLLLGIGFFVRFAFAPKTATESAPAEASLMKESGAGAAAPAETAAAAEAAPEEELCALPTAPAMEAAEDAASNANTAATSGTNTAAEPFYPGIIQLQYLEALPGASTVACFSGSPAPQLFRSRAELEAYRDKPIQQFDPENLMQACEAYDDAWFEDHDLLLISLCSVSASDGPQITAIRQQDGLWEIALGEYRTSTKAERKDWHILLEVEKDLIPDADCITLIYE